MLFFVLPLALWLWRVLRRVGLLRSSGHRRRAGAIHDSASRIIRFQPKPRWVRTEIIRLRAWSPELSCRIIAETFSRQFAHRRMSVGKTYVADTLRKQHVDVLRLRRAMKHRIPPPQPRNITWGLDLTGKADLSGRQHAILGLVDHGTRACLRLQRLNDKSSLTILGELITAFRRFGVPGRIRVDNEACMTSLLMRMVLALLGIDLQVIQLHCPWQNGRIERFFGTLKGKLDRIAVPNGVDLNARLVEFRAWYNHLRTHQHLHGLTPAEAWSGRPKSTGQPEWVEIWEGRITGWYFPH